MQDVSQGRVCKVVCKIQQSSRLVALVGKSFKISNTSSVRDPHNFARRSQVIREIMREVGVSRNTAKKEKPHWALQPEKVSSYCVNCRNLARAEEAAEN